MNNDHPLTQMKTIITAMRKSRSSEGLDQLEVLCDRMAVVPTEHGDLVRRLLATGGKGECGPLKAEAAAAIEKLVAEIEALRTPSSDTTRLMWVQIERERCAKIAESAGCGDPACRKCLGNQIADEIRQNIRADAGREIIHLTRG